MWPGSIRIMVRLVDGIFVSLSACWLRGAVETGIRPRSIIPCRGQARSRRVKRSYSMGPLVVDNFAV